MIKRTTVDGLISCSFPLVLSSSLRITFHVSPPDNSGGFLKESFPICEMRCSQRPIWLLKPMIQSF